MNTFQTILAYAIAALTLTAFLWACVRALRKRFAGEPCTGYTEEEKKYMRENTLPIHHPPTEQERHDAFVNGMAGLFERNAEYQRLLRAEEARKEAEIAASKARGLEPILNDFVQFRGERDMPWFTGYIKSLSDEDLWAMKGLSKPLAKIRKTEMDVRRRRNAKKAAARKVPLPENAGLFGKPPVLVTHQTRSGEDVVYPVPEEVRRRISVRNDFTGLDKGKFSEIRNMIEDWPPAIAGQRGHETLWGCTKAVVKSGASFAQSWSLLCWYNDHKCTPKWSAEELFPVYIREVDAERERRTGMVVPVKQWDWMHFDLSGTQTGRMSSTEPNVTEAPRSLDESRFENRGHPKKPKLLDRPLLSGPVGVPLGDGETLAPDALDWRDFCVFPADLVGWDANGSPVFENDDLQTVREYRLRPASDKGQAALWRSRR